MNPRNIAIIGAGPAGLIAAEQLAQAGHRVTLHERMASPARKFLLAGRGGLNLSHSEPLERFLPRYREALPWLEPALQAFPPQALRDWADGLGAETFTGSSGRIFPRAMKASPLLRAWLRRLDQLGVRLETGRLWAGWTGDGALAFKLKDGTEISELPDATLLALGGASWPRLGSDGGWVALLTAEGVPIASLRAANAGFTVSWSQALRERFSGAPLKRISLRFQGQQASGEAMLDRDGIEGGAFYALSAPLREAILREGHAEVTLDLRPDIEIEALSQRLSRRRSGETLSNHLRKAGLAPAAIAVLRDAVGGPLPQEPDALAALIKAAPLRLTGMQGLERAISTAGGVTADAITAHFMLKAKPGVFVAGEMLDWEAPTGGYLLQASMATGVAAAQGIIAYLGAEAA